MLEKDLDLQCNNAILKYLLIGSFCCAQSLALATPSDSSCSPTQLAVWVKGLSSFSIHTRDASHTALVSAGQKAKSLLVAALPKATPHRRFEIADVLASTGNWDIALPHILDTLGDPSEVRRLRATTLLEQYGLPGVDTLVATLGDPDVAKQESSFQVLMNLPGVLPLLEPHLQNAPVAVKIKILDLMMLFSIAGNEHGTPALIQALGDPELQSVAAKKLAKMGSETLIPLICQSLRTTTGDPRDYLIWSLKRIATFPRYAKTVLKQLALLAHADNPDLRIMAFSTVLLIQHYWEKRLTELEQAELAGAPIDAQGLADIQSLVRYIEGITFLFPADVHQHFKKPPPSPKKIRRPPRTKTLDPIRALSFSTHAHPHPDQKAIDVSLDDPDQQLRDQRYIFSQASSVLKTRYAPFEERERAIHYLTNVETPELLPTLLWMNLYARDVYGYTHRITVTLEKALREKKSKVGPQAAQLITQILEGDPSETILDRDDETIRFAFTLVDSFDYQDENLYARASAHLLLYSPPAKVTFETLSQLQALAKSSDHHTARMAREALDRLHTHPETPEKIRGKIK